MVLRKKVRRQLYNFASRVARVVPDTRRQRFIREMITGLVIGRHVHLTKIARAAGRGTENVHAAEKRLSRHLRSQHGSMKLCADWLLGQSAAMVGEDSLIVADLTDLSKPFARHLEGLGRVRDASSPEKRTVPGYVIFETYVRVRRWQFFPLVMEPLRTYGGAATSENVEILRYLEAIYLATEGRGLWVLDRGFDRRELLWAMLLWGMAFIVRQRGDRKIVLTEGREVIMEAYLREVYESRRAEQWSGEGWTYTAAVRLPEAPDQELLLVAYWALPGRTPLMLLVSPRARQPGRSGRWFVDKYRRRWGVEDATRGVKQLFHLEGFLVRSWRSIQHLLWLVAIAFYWLNLWGEERFDQLREALMAHPWRVPKKVTYLFDWLATQIAVLLQPKPKFTPRGFFDTG